MAWRFRLGSRREEPQGAGVEVADPVAEESHSPDASAEEPVAAAASSDSAESSVAETSSSDLLQDNCESNTSKANSENDAPADPGKLESSAALDDAPSDELISESAAESEATSHLARDAASDSATDAGTENGSETERSSEAAPLIPHFPAIASDWAFEEKLAMHKEW